MPSTPDSANSDSCEVGAMRKRAGNYSGGRKLLLYIVFVTTTFYLRYTAELQQGLTS